MVGATVGVNATGTAGEQATPIKTKIYPRMRNFLIRSLFLDWSSLPYSIPVFRFHPSEGLSLQVDLRFFLREHPCQHVLDHLIPVWPIMFAGSLFVCQVELKLTNRIAEADIIRIQIVFHAAALIEPWFDRSLGNFFGKCE